VNAESRGFGRPIAVAGRREKKVIHPPQPQNRIEQADAMHDPTTVLITVGSLAT